MSKIRTKYIIGIDEVGRGPLAGPVTVAALGLPRNFQFPNPNLQETTKLRLRDSKKLSPKKREIWFQYIKNHPEIFYAIVSVSSRVVDKINIANAANLAATRALSKLLDDHPNGLLKKTKVFLDGRLYLHEIRNSNFKLRNCRTVVRGDEKIPAIMLASIVAKVVRDRKMKILHGKYPKYDFLNNMGYGTRRHVRAIKKHGPSKIHRLTFIGKYVKIQ